MAAKTQPCHPADLLFSHQVRRLESGDHGCEDAAMPPFAAMPPGEVVRIRAFRLAIRQPGALQ
jgi:hypothetical protein